MNIKSVSHPKVLIGIIEVIIAKHVNKAISNFKMYKYNISIGSYPIHITTLIFSLDWTQILSGYMSYDFLCCCIMFCSRIAIGVRNMPCMMSGLIMKTLCVKAKTPYFCSDLIVAGLKKFPFVYVT